MPDVCPDLQQPGMYCQTCGDQSPPGSRLAALPGLSGGDADRVTANCPYEKRRDLVRKGVLSESKFDKIRDAVYVDHEKD